MRQRSIAIITGWTIVIMAATAGFVFGYAFPEFSQIIHEKEAYESLQAKKGLYTAMLLGILFIQLLDVIASYTCYKFFEPVHRGLALAAGWLRLVYTLIFIAGTVGLVQNLTTSAPSGKTILSSMHLFENTWTFGLIIFGVHLFLLGLLMKRHSNIHKALWILTLLAGCSYSVISALKLLEYLPEVTSTLEVVLALPMTLGELGLAVWMLLKGGKSTHDTLRRKELC